MSSTFLHLMKLEIYSSCTLFALLRNVSHHLFHFIEASKREARAKERTSESASGVGGPFLDPYVPFLGAKTQLCERVQCGHRTACPPSFCRSVGSSVRSPVRNAISQIGERPCLAVSNLKESMPGLVKLHPASRTWLLIGALAFLLLVTSF